MLLDVKRMPALDNAGSGNSAPVTIQTRYADSTPPPDPSGLTAMYNQAARLKPGNLIVVYLARNACFQVNPESGRAEYLFTISHEQSPFLWRALASPQGEIFCTTSGMRRPDLATKDAAFGLAGAVVRVDHRLAESRVLTTTGMIDPCGMQLLDEQSLLVCDFAGFGGTGAIHLVDRVTGLAETIAEGGLLADPVSAYQDDDGVIWVANSFMHYYYSERGGVIEKDDGEIIAIGPDKRQTVRCPRQSPARGSMVGIHPSNDPDYLVAIKGDWPVMETGAVLLVNKRNGAVETLLSASPSEPRFYSTHLDVVGDILWVGESYRKQILAYDLKQREVVKTIDFSDVMGGYDGVASSFEGIESVAVVPLDLRA